MKLIMSVAAVLALSTSAISASVLPRNSDNGGFAVNPTPPPLEFLYEMFCETGPPINIPNTPSGLRGIYPIVGGPFKGPKISGKVLNLGADWGSSSKPEDPNNFYPDTRYNLLTDDGTNIYIRTTGAYQFDGVGFLSAKFETSMNGSYAWINDVVGAATIELVTAPILNTTLATPKTKADDVLRIRMWHFKAGTMPVPAP